jgi:tetratricopeptide (TPR) repeat protein
VRSRDAGSAADALARSLPPRGEVGILRAMVPVQRRTRAAVALALVALVGVWIAHGVGLHAPFHFDDFHSLKDNVWIRDLAHWPRYFTDVSVFSPLEENRAYRPFLLLGFAASYVVGGGASWAFHVFSLAIHAVGVVIIGLLGRRLAAAAQRGASSDRGPLSPEEARLVDRLALLGATIFAVHPLFGEAVVYLSARSSLQAAVFTFLALHLYVVAREDRRPRLVGLAALVLVVGMGTKIIAMTTPALALGWELLLGPDRPGRTGRWGLPRAAWVGLGVLGAVASICTVGHELFVGASARTVRSSISPMSYLLTETQVWLRFVGLFVWPAGLSADLTMPWARSALEGPVMRAILLDLALIVGALGLARRAPLVTFGVVFFFIALSPTNSIMPLSEPASEHRVYIAGPGLVWIVLGALRAPLARLAYAPAALGFAALAPSAALVLALVPVTRARVAVWSSEETLWADVIATSPDNGRAHLNYGLARMGKGDFVAARASFERCASAWPNWLFCPVNQAALALAEHDLPRAEAHAARARQLAPDNVYVLVWSGRVARARERWDEAVGHYARAVQVAPGHPDARLGLAVARLMRGEVDAAAPELRALPDAARSDAQGAWALGWLADREGHADVARAWYTRALELDPAEARSRYNLAVLEHKAGALDAARAHYERLVADRHDGPDVWWNLALVLAARGEADAAARWRAKVEAEAPGYAPR